MLAVVVLVWLAGGVWIAAPILTRDVDRYQAEQTQMAKDYLLEQVVASPASIQLRSGTSSAYLYGSFEASFKIGQQQYTVVHENVWWKALPGKKGRFSLGR